MEMSTFCCRTGGNTEGAKRTAECCGMSFCHSPHLPRRRRPHHPSSFSCPAAPARHTACQKEEARDEFTKPLKGFARFSTENLMCPWLRLHAFVQPQRTQCTVTVLCTSTVYWESVVCLMFASIESEFRGPSRANVRSHGTKEMACRSIRQG